MSNSRPIGFIDSGFGGLTVVKEALKQLPNETIYFFGDSKRCPYGTRTKEEVVRFTKELVAFLMEHDIKLLVIACNTATALALPTIKKMVPIPVVGVIDPGSRAAIKKSLTNHIGVIATNGTVSSNVYETTIQSKKSVVDVTSVACQPLVSLVEEGLTSGEKVDIQVNRLLTPLKQDEIDVLILGCTHYPLLKESIEKTMGKNVTLIDSGAEAINDVSMLLDYFNIANTTANKEPMHRFFTTGDKDRFKYYVEKWLQLPYADVTTIDLD